MLAAPLDWGNAEGVYFGRVGGSPAHASVGPPIQGPDLHERQQPAAGVRESSRLTPLVTPVGADATRMRSGSLVKKSTLGIAALVLVMGTWVCASLATSEGVRSFPPVQAMRGLNRSVGTWLIARS